MSSSTERTASTDPTVRNFSLTRSTSVVWPACDLILHLPRPPARRNLAATRDRSLWLEARRPLATGVNISQDALTVRATAALLRRTVTFAGSQAGRRRTVQPAHRRLTLRRRGAEVNASMDEEEKYGDRAQRERGF